jgi:hypothetical protein
MRRSIRWGSIAVLLVLGCTNPPTAANTTEDDVDGGFTSSTGDATPTATMPPMSGSEPGTTSSDTTAVSSSDTPTTSGSGEPDASSSTGGDAESTGRATESAGSSSDGESSSASSGGLEPFDFEDFDDPEGIDAWFIRDVVEGTPAQYTTLDFDVTASSNLTIIPTTSGWFNDYDGPFVYKLVSGDFMMETHVNVTGLADPDGPPTQTYNSAGLMLRDPANVPMGEDWVVHNTGYQEYQEFGVASEGKITINSSSTLTTSPGAHFGRLRICRFGGDIAVARYLDGDDGWTDTVEPYPDLLPDEVQAGVAVTAWNSTGNDPDFDEDPDMIAHWDYVAFYLIDDMSQCYEG